MRTGAAAGRHDGIERDRGRADMFIARVGHGFIRRPDRFGAAGGQQQSCEKGEDQSFHGVYRQIIEVFATRVRLPVNSALSSQDEGKRGNSAAVDAMAMWSRHQTVR